MARGGGAAGRGGRAAARIAEVVGGAALGGGAARGGSVACGEGAVAVGGLLDKEGEVLHEQLKWWEAPH